MKRVLLLMCKGTEIFEAAAFHDVLGWSEAVASEPVAVVTAGFERQIRCTFGLQVCLDVSLFEVKPEDFDALAIPGGFEQFGFYEEAYREEMSNLIRQFCALKKPVATICVGALPVGKAGVLRSRRATTYPGQRRIQLAEFGVDVVDALIVSDGNIVTSTGPGTAVEVALGLLEALTGHENAERVRQAMGFGGSGS